MLKALGQKSSLNRPNSCSTLFEYEDEKFYDLIYYLEALNSANNDIASQELDSFFDWCQNRLIVSKVSKTPDASYSGLSIYVPSSDEAIERYSFLPIYQQTDIEDVFTFMFEK